MKIANVPLKKISAYFVWFTSLALLWASFFSIATAQSWNPANGTFNGSGGFTATEINDWIGPQFSANNGGELTFAGNAEHTGQTAVESGSSVIIGGSLNHTNAFQRFVVSGSDGAGGFSSLSIEDPANSDVISASFQLDNTSLSLNSITTGSTVVRLEAQLDVIEDLDSDGVTSIESGAQVSVGGALNHTNAFQRFVVSGTDGAGGFSSLSIGDPDNSDVISASFQLDNTSLALNSITTGSTVVRNGAQLDVIGELSSSGVTSIESGAQVSVGDSFNHTNAFERFVVSGSDGAGGFSSLSIEDIINSNVNSASFQLDNTSLGLNSITTGSTVVLSLIHI